MSVLAIDTASRERALLALCDPDGLVIAWRAVTGGHLDGGLPAALAELLRAELSAVVVLTGPGSYNGVRAGMAAGLGVAASRGVPLHGVGNLTALAVATEAAEDAELTALADAGRGGVYAARFAAVRAGEVGQLTPIERLTVAEVGGGRLVAAGAIAGLGVEIVEPLRAVAAAVPVGLATPALSGAGLAAVHARPPAMRGGC